MGILELFLLKPLAFILFKLGGIVISFLGAALTFLLNPTRLATFMGSIFYTAVNRLSQEKAVKQLIEQRRLPQDKHARNAKQHDENAASRCYRIRYYLQLRRQRLQALDGPYGASLYVALLLEQPLQSWQGQFHHGLQQFDRLEAQARRLIYRYDEVLQGVRGDHLPRLDQLDDQLVRVNYLMRATVGRMRPVRPSVVSESATLTRWQRFKRWLDRQWHWLRPISRQKFTRLQRRFWRYWRKRSQLKRERRELQRQLDRHVRRVDALFGPRLELCLRRLHRHEDRQLMHRAHVLEADWMSLLLTVETGRLAERLTTDTARCREVREHLQLTDLPWHSKALLAAIAQRVPGIGPHWPVEDIVELFLRQHLQSIDQSMVCKAWLAALPPPSKRLSSTVS